MTGRQAPGQPSFASRSVTRHLARGVAGFGLLVASVALLPAVGLPSLVLAPLGLLALHGCPTCWVIGLLQTISRGRWERDCRDGSCRLGRAGPGRPGRPETADQVELWSPRADPPSVVPGRRLRPGASPPAT